MTYRGGGVYKDRPEIIFLQKWTGQEILEAWFWRLIGRATQKVNKKDKTGQATHISGQSL